MLYFLTVCTRTHLKQNHFKWLMRTKHADKLYDSCSLFSFFIWYTPRCNPTIHVTLTLKVVSVFTIRTNFSFLKCILDIQLFPLLFLSLNIFQWQIYFVNIIFVANKTTDLCHIWSQMFLCHTHAHNFRLRDDMDLHFYSFHKLFDTLNHRC